MLKQIIPVIKIKKSYQWQVNVSFLLLFMISVLISRNEAQVFSDLNQSMTGLRNSAVVWGDYDEDGDLDVLVSGSSADGTPVTKIYRNDNGVFVDINASLSPVSRGSLAWGDYDNDGDLDILASGYNGSNVSVSMVYRNDSGTFVDIGAPLAANYDADCLWGDIDGDGDLDILLTGAGKLYENSNGTFAESTASDSIEAFRDGGAAAFGDYDNDGDQDILMSGNTYDTRIYRNDGGKFTDIRFDFAVSGYTGYTNDGVRFASVAWSDFDGDGKLDFALCGEARNSEGGGTGTPNNIVAVFRNGGPDPLNAGGWLFGDIDSSPFSRQISGAQRGSIAWGDYDNDGDPDLLVCGAIGTTISQNDYVSQVYRNDGNGIFTLDSNASGALLGVGHSQVAWGDFDNDGDLDIVLSGYSGTTDGGLGNISKIYRNNNNPVDANTPPSVPAGLTATTAGDSVTLSWGKASDSKSPQNGLQYNIRIGITAGGTEVVSPMADQTSGLRLLPAAGNAGQNTSITIKSMSDGEYYWSVQAIDNNFAGSGFAGEKSFTIGVPPYPSTYSLNSTVTFPSHANASEYSAADYRLVGLPGAGNQPISSILPGNQNSDWQVYWDNGSSSTNSSDYLAKFDGSANFNTTVGKAFWVIQKGDLDINTNVSTAALDAGQEVSIPLHTGWNLITNPFNQSIQWSAVQAANGSISEPIHTFNGNFSTSDTFQPYVGYYFFNDPNNALDVLKVSYASAFSKPAAAQGEANDGWRADIVLKAADLPETALSFGTYIEASNGLDSRDHRRPRPVGELPDILFQRPQWDHDFSQFESDIRMPVQNLEIWNFTIKTPENQNAEITFSGISTIPSRLEIYLVDPIRGYIINLRDSSRYSITPATEETPLKVLVGTHGAMQSELSHLIPHNFVLDQNFPNPFNPTTMIRFGIQQNEVVSLRIFDTLGREIVTLLNNQPFNAGYHSVVWNGQTRYGKPAASGVYLYNLQAGSFSMTKKMLLVK